jgi:CHAT domain-containing protein
VSCKEITYAITRGAEHFGDMYDRMGLRWGNLPGTLEEVQEIAGLEIEAEFVNLSACDTGFGQNLCRRGG